MSRVATISADDFVSPIYGNEWDWELYWGIFLWELGLLDREPRRVMRQDEDGSEDPGYQAHHFGLYDRDWQKMQTIREVQVVPVEGPSRRGAAVIHKTTFKPESFERIVDELLEMPGTKRVQVALANVAEAIVEALLENDPKDLAMRASAGLSPDTMIKFQCPFTSQGQAGPRPYYFSDDLGDWAGPEDGGWDRGEAFRLGDYIKDGVIDLNDMPFGTESVIVVNPDGSPGAEFSIEDLDLGTAQVIDTYVNNYEQGREGG
jgi:hypothetical protein